MALCSDERCALANGRILSCVSYPKCPGVARLTGAARTALLPESRVRLLRQGRIQSSLDSGTPPQLGCNKGVVPSTQRALCFVAGSFTYKTGGPICLHAGHGHKLFPLQAVLVWQLGFWTTGKVDGGFVLLIAVDVLEVYHHVQGIG
ncbi:hypothetical protein EYF80_007488 [Liparis tanakae]|uniref:Uncharacterized protein n=1 Tax=Liparis tanakae TaxID=230148 RepID=A0A4Z2IX77_9TELE|nr:hypothetical protein EYF80_007488 [Liparis tanakae]